MNQDLYDKLNKVLAEEGNQAIKEKDYLKVQDILHIRMILDDLDELEPTLEKYFNEKAQKRKFNRER